MTIKLLISNRYKIRHTREGGYPGNKVIFYDFINKETGTRINLIMAIYVNLMALTPDLLKFHKSIKHFFSLTPDTPGPDLTFNESMRLDIIGISCREQ